MLFDLTRGEDYLQMECGASATSYPLGTNGDAAAAASATTTQGSSIFASATAAVPNGRAAYIKRALINNTTALVATFTIESHNGTTTGFTRAIQVPASSFLAVELDIFTQDGFRATLPATMTATVVYKAGVPMPTRPGANP